METIEVKTEYEPDIGPIEMSFEVIDIPEPPKRISSWSNIETKQLIDLFKSLIVEIGPNKRFMRKKDMWEEISSNFPTKSAKQCEERFKTVLRRKRKGLEYLPDKKSKIIDLGDSDESCQTLNDLNNYKHVYVWSNNETRQLMDLYKRFICEVGPHKRFVHKKDMWSEISLYFTNKDPKQCEQRYKTVLKRKKKGTTFITRRKSIDFKTKVMKVKEIKTNRIPKLDKDNITDSMEIEEKDIRKSTYSSDPITLVDEDHTSQENSADINVEFNVQDSCELTIRKTLLEISAKKEAAKERRHKERMEALNKMLNLLEKLLSSNGN